MSSTSVKPIFNNLFKNDVQYNYQYLRAVTTYNLSICVAGGITGDSIRELCGIKSEDHLHSGGSGVNDSSSSSAKSVESVLSESKGKCAAASVVGLPRGPNYDRNRVSREKRKARHKESVEKSQERVDLENKLAVAKLKVELGKWDSPDFVAAKKRRTENFVNRALRRDDEKNSDVSSKASSTSDKSVSVNSSVSRKFDTAHRELLDKRADALLKEISDRKARDAARGVSDASLALNSVASAAGISKSTSSRTLFAKLGLSSTGDPIK